MATSQLPGNLPISLSQTLPNEGTNNIGKIENGQTIQTSKTQTFSTEKLSNTSANMTNKDYGHHKVQINSTTSMPTLMSKDLCEINKASNIDEHTILSKELRKNISCQFAMEIEKLSEIVDSLGKNLNNEIDFSKSIAIYDALKEINGFITRYQNTGLGGFDKEKHLSSTTKLLFDDLSKDFQKKIDKYKEVTQKIPNCEDEAKQLDAQKKEFYDLCKTEIPNAQEIVAKNLEMLTAFLISSPNSSIKIGNTGTNIEKTFNILQENAMSGWIINDIVPKLENVDKACGTTLANQLKTEGDSQILNKIQILNNATRALPMFSETDWKSLLTNDIKNSSNVAIKLLKDHPFTKIGIRGRSRDVNSSLEKDPLQSKRKPLQENLSNSIKTDPGLTNSFSPNPTCSRDAVPKDFIDGLNYAYLGDNSSYEDQINAGLILKDLEAKGAVKFNTDSNTYESIQSFGAIIDDAGLPTYCSVSGTTTELLACLYYKADENTQTHMKATFEFLLNIARGEDATIPNGFVKIFTPIALFMEAGQFHTSAEVLGGMYGTAVAWANVQAENSESKDMKAMIDGFKNILNFYKGHMNEFWGQVSQPQLQVQPQN